MTWFDISRRQWHQTGQGLLADRNNRSIFLSLKQDMDAFVYLGGITSPAVNGKTVALDNTVEALLPGSDRLNIRDIPMAFCPVQANMGHAFVSAKGACQKKLSFHPVKPGNRALLMDDTGGEWVRIAEIRDTGFQLSSPIERVYGDNAHLIPVEKVTYFVSLAPYGTTKAYTLFRRIEGYDAMGLVGGILGFNVQYALQQNGRCHPGHYFYANQVKDWSDVCRMRVTWRLQHSPRPLQVEFGVRNVFP